jgi:hypothetical protein
MSTDLHQLPPDKLRKNGISFVVFGSVVLGIGVVCIGVGSSQPGSSGDGLIGIGSWLATTAMVPVFAGAYMLLLSRFREGLLRLYAILLRLTIFGVAIAVVWWLAFSFFYAPYSRDESHTRDEARVQKATAQLYSVVGSEDVRLQLLKGFNAELYMPRAHFEAIAYPDREQYVSSLGRSWCSEVDHTFFPSLAVRDIRTGEELASYSCFREHASLNNLSK